MTGRFMTLLKNDAGFTAIEYSLIVAFSLALMGQLVNRF